LNGIDDGFKYLRYIYGDQIIPSFATSREARQFCKTLSKSVSNPEPLKFPKCKHIISVLTTWEQVQKYLVHQRDKMLNGNAASTISDEQLNKKKSLESNIFLKSLEKDSNDDLASSIARKCVVSKLGSHPVYAKRDNPDSFLNTLKYLFFHMRSGIYVLIKNNRLQMFVPFASNDYRNCWHEEKTIRMSQEEVDLYFRRKYEIFPDLEGQNYLKDVSKWWANGNILNNVPMPEIWGDHSLVQFRDMLLKTCKKLKVDDAEFFINKRDFPHLKPDFTEPYDFLFDQTEAIPLRDSCFPNYLPIFSPFCSLESYADIPFPTVDDWEVATGKVFIPKCRDLYSEKNFNFNWHDWDDKVPTAFFRGSATGVGVTTEANQRLKLACLSLKWADCNDYNESNSVDGVRFLDAGVTSWNCRDKKSKGLPLSFIQPSLLPISLVEGLPLCEQMKFKYLIYVDGHCAAGRYSYLMCSGSVILKVESITCAKDIWFFPLLRPWVDHIPIAADLSDLAEKILWCKQNDGKCKKIVEHAQDLYWRYVSQNSIQEYLQFAINKISALGQ
jgi:hypothetical protein